MARQEANREDLFAELVTHVPRWEFRVQRTGEVFVAGCRQDGRWTVYRESGDYFQLTASGQLRRAFQGMRMLLSTGQTLAELTRHRSEAATTLLRRDLDRGEREEFIRGMRDCFKELLQEFAKGEPEVLRGTNEDLVGTLAPLLQSALAADPPLADSITRE